MAPLADAHGARRRSGIPTLASQAESAVVMQAVIVPVSEEPTIAPGHGTGGVSPDTQFFSLDHLPVEATSESPTSPDPQRP